MNRLFISECLVIMFGGAVGSVLRFLLSRWVQGVAQNDFFPWGIVSVNIIGSFAIGIFTGIIVERYNGGPLLRAGFIIGLLGGFTTFSSFSLDTITLLNANEYFAALMNIVVTLGGCLLATFVGLVLVRIVL